MEIRTDFRDLMKAELVVRVKKNASYSSRAFARDLGISNPFLSQILNGTRSLSEEKGLQIAKNLNWDDSKTNGFLKLVRLDRCKDPVLKSRLYSEIQEESSNSYFNLEMEKFQLVSDWIHFAIMELTTVKNFKSESNWISKRLGITVTQCEDAIQRLLTLELLMNENGKLKLTKNVAIGDVPSSATRKFHRTHLEKAIVALEKNQHHEHHLSGITFAIDPEKLPIANEMIRKFRRKLAKTLGNGELSRVYQLSVQLIPLDKLEKSK